MNRIQQDDSLPKPQTEDGQQEQPFDFQPVLRAALYWWKVTVPVGLVLAAAAVGAVIYFSQPTYTAAAWLIIREKPEYLLNPHVMEDPRKFVQNQMELMRSPPVIDPVANKPEVFAAPELADGDPAERLRRLLKVTAQGQSDFFVIQFTSRDAQKAALIVNEIAKAYLVLQDRDLSRRMEATITRLERQRADQQQLIERLRGQVQEKTKALTGVDPYAVKVGDGQLRISDSVSPLQAQIVEAEIDHAITAAQVEAEEELLKNQTFDVPQSDIDARVQSLAEVQALRKRIADAQILIKGHERTSANLKKDSNYQYLLKQQEADQKQLTQRIGELRSIVKTEMEQAARVKRSDEVAAMRRSLDAKRLSVDILRERMQKERANQQVYKGETVELEFLRTDYESAAKVFEAINDRIVTMRMEQHAPDRVMLFKEAVPPAFPDEALPLKRMSLAGALAFLLPLGLAIGFEMLHRRVSDRQQLEATSRLPVMAEITSMPRRVTSNSAASLQRVHRELQLFEECIYGLRTQLTLSCRAGSMRTVAITSAISREGKTSVAVQLALSIARSSGERTLLIDGDLRCPDIHRIFEIERSPGLTEVLQKQVELDDAIDTDYSPNLHLLTAGKLETLPHCLLGNAAFPRLLDTLKERYAYIVIDTPPILPASESLMIARAADVTVVCARRDYSRLDQVADAYARLRNGGIRVAGAVLSGISPRAYAYRYGSYYYDRGLERNLAVIARDRNPPRDGERVGA